MPKIVPLDANMKESIEIHRIKKWEGEGFIPTEDQVVMESPLEIQLKFFSKNKWESKSLAITMRTPGEDIALALGFLFTEGIIGAKANVELIEKVADNVLRIQLIKEIVVDLAGLELSLIHI